MSEVYKVGSLSDIIQKSSKSKKKSDDKELSKLASLFTAPAPTISKYEISNYNISKEQKKERADEKQKNKKRKLHGDTSASPSKKLSNLEGYEPPPGIVHEALLRNDNKESDEKADFTRTERKARHRNRRDRTKDPRTVFVGNLPISYNKKQVKKLFKSCGKIDSIRFRCPPPADLKLPKRAIVITKSFHKDRQNIISYVCFEEEESAQKALKLNGREIDGFHIRVDISSNAKKHEKKNTVFVGNMSYDVTENEVWGHFEDCGEIENVRIIRDNKTGTGKGIGYVQFKDKDGVQFALKLHESELNGRQLRVMRCDTKKKKEKISKVEKEQPSKSEKKYKKLSFKSTNKKTEPFQHTVERKNKHLKKKTKPKHVRFNTKSHSKQKSKDKNLKHKKKLNKK